MCKSVDALVVYPSSVNYYLFNFFIYNGRCLFELCDEGLFIAVAQQS